MVPQGSTTLNTSVISELTEQINSINLCADLQALTNEAFASLAPIKAAIEAEIAQLLPVLDLLVIPAANLGAILGWISNFITSVLTPMVKPYETYIAQLAELTQQIAALAAAIQAAEARIVNCTITIPVV